MGYYLPPKSYLRPKPRVTLRRKLIAVATTFILMIGAGVITSSIQFGNSTSTFANSADDNQSNEISMPVPLVNTNMVISEGEHPEHFQLPVILAYFKATRFSKSIALKWSTMLEYKNDYFIVEKSRNGTDFTEIGCVESLKLDGISSDYKFVDDSVADVNVYYRLRQISENGKSTYIALEKVEGKNENNDLSLFIEQIGPLPFDNFFNINYYTNRPGGISVELFDKSGKKVYKTYTDAVQGFNTCRFIDGQNLIDDEYTLRIANSSGAYVKKIKKKV